MSEDRMPGPLSGLKVLDIATIIAAPGAAALLADYGADVLKVELPGAGDGARDFPPFREKKSLWWKVTNRNKRFATLDDEESIADLASEMEDRFGPPPPPAAQLVRAMSLRPMLREFRALGCEATASRVTLHLRDDTPLDPRKIIPLVGQPRSPWKITPDMKLTRRFDESEPGDAIDRVRALFGMLRPLQKGVA